MERTPKNDSPGLQAFRGDILHFLKDPETGGDDAAYEFIEDGLLIVDEGLVRKAGPYATLSATLPEGTPVTDYRGQLIVPGFVDTHIHYPQTDVIASYGTRLLDWLEKYTFPMERAFEDGAVAREAAEFFIGELLKNGTTTAQVMCTVHRESAETYLATAFEKNLRMISGKMLMDRNAPDYLLDTPEEGFEDSLALARKWHGKGRLSYAVTPRFAPTSTEAQLERAGELMAAMPGLHFHTHLSENKEEIAWVAELFPWSDSYLSVYDRFGLVGERSLFAHAIHLSDKDRRRMAEAGASVAFCPTSNLFIGSGLFDLGETRGKGIPVGMATDVGGGTSFSMLQTLACAYQVCQLRNMNLSPLRAFYLATLGGAEALRLDDAIGNFTPGKEADFTVLAGDATPLIERRMGRAETLAERLFILMMLGDDRSISATHVMGRPLYQKAPGR